MSSFLKERRLKQIHFNTTYIFLMQANSKHVLTGFWKLQNNYLAKTPDARFYPHKKNVYTIFKDHMIKEFCLKNEWIC